MAKQEQRGAAFQEIQAMDFSGGMQAKTISPLAQNNQVLHLVNMCLDKKLGALIGRNGSVEKKAVGDTVVGIKVYRNGSTKKYLVFYSNGSNIVIGTAQNSDFSGTLTAALSGHFADDVNVHSATFATKEMFFNGVTAPRQYDGSSFSAITNAPTTGKFPDVYQQRLYVFGIDSFLHYSDVINSSGDGFSSTTWSNRGINPNDGQTPKGMRRHRGRLVLFKTESIYRFDGSNEPEPIINIGTHSERGIVQTDSSIFFHHPTGIYEMSLGDPILISRPVEKYLRGMSSANWENVSAGKSNDGEVFFWIGDVTINDPWEWDYRESYSNVVLVYNWRLERWTRYTGWDARIWLLNTDDGKQYFVRNDGDIVYVDPTRYNDDNTPIPYDVLWHPIHYGVPYLRKMVDRIVINGSPDVKLSAGDRPDRMVAQGAPDGESIMLRQEINFNNLWIRAHGSYSSTPAIIEQLSIGKAYVRNTA